jgi:hypothetical protein
MVAQKRDYVGAKGRFFGGEIQVHGGSDRPW